jgi:hypothetical protein
MVPTLYQKREGIYIYVRTIQSKSSTYDKKNTKMPENAKGVWLGTVRDLPMGIL